VRREDQHLSEDEIIFFQKNGDLHLKSGAVRWEDKPEVPQTRGFAFLRENYLPHSCSASSPSGDAGYHILRPPPEDEMQEIVLMMLFKLS